MAPAAPAPLRRRPLGRTGIEVTEVGFGAWAIGGNEHGNSLGPTDDAVSRAAIDAALEAGITFFDTSDIYGWGKSERLLGEALGAARAGVVLATKGGADVSNPAALRKCYEPDYLRTALARSLERLRTDRVDLYQIHDPPLEAIRSPATQDALRRIKEEGLARAVGVSLHTLDEGLAALESGAYDTIQVAYNVGNQWAAGRLLEPARARGVGFIAREPLAQGYLAGAYGPDHDFGPGDVRGAWPREHRAFLAELSGRMRDYFHVRRKLDRPLAAIALQFVLAEPSVATVIASMKTPAQVAANVAAAGMPALAKAELAWLRE